MYHEMVLGPMGVRVGEGGTVWFECEISPAVLHVCRLDPQMVKKPRGGALLEEIAMGDGLELL